MNRIAVAGISLIAVKLILPSADDYYRRIRCQQHQQPRHKSVSSTIWGSNQFGVVQPQSTSSLIIKQPIPLPVDGPLRSLALGRYHAAAVDAQGDLYRWGAVAVLGPAISNATSPVAVNWPAHSPQCVLRDPLLQNIQVDATSVYGLRSTGEVIVISDTIRSTTTNVQTPTAAVVDIKRLPKPSPMRSSERLVDIKSGSGSATSLLIALSTQGRVFQWHESSGAWELLRLPGDSKVDQIACGEAHCLARTNDGRLFGWGSNKYGQLGVNSVEQPSIATPTEIRSVWTLPNSTYAPSKSLTVANNNSSSSELKITHIAAGDHSSYVVQSSAEQVSLISFGCGQQGQLGNGMNVQMTAAPVRIKSLSYLYQYDDHRKSMVPIAIERVYAGARHAIAVLGTGDGLVFGKDLLGWGSNLAGECGTGVKGGSISTPTNVTAGVAVSDRRQIFLANALPASSANGKGLRGWFGREKSAQNTERYSETVACGDQTTCIYQTC